MAEILTTPDQLASALEHGAYEDGGPVRVLDVRWRLDRPDGREDYRAGHIPGALYVDLDTQLATRGEPGEGRHPLPSEERFREVVHELGINGGDTVVVYDNLTNLSSSRAWWLLRYAGIEDVRLLDGALEAWTDAGLPLETGDAATPTRGTATVRYGALPALALAEVTDFAGAHTLLDARAGERYRGENEPVDPRAGHIPGAVSAPTTENTDAHGRFLPAPQLRERFRALGVTSEAPVGVYCGSGVTAAHEAVALSLAGFTPQVFAGSWSQWSNHPELPLATGPTPDGA